MKIVTTFRLTITLIVLTVILVVLGVLMLMSNDEGNEISINNSSLENSPIIQDSPGVSITYIDTADLIHNQQLEIWDDFFDKFDSKYDLFNVKVNLVNSKQELFLNEFFHDQKIIIAYCNEQVSDCKIVKKYQTPSNLNENDVCFILNLDHFADRSLALSQGPKFNREKDECYKQISGDRDVLGEWITD